MTDPTGALVALPVVDLPMWLMVRFAGKPVGVLP
jgi:hypothetical protein